MGTHEPGTTEHEGVLTLNAVVAFYLYPSRVRWPAALWTALTAVAIVALRAYLHTSAPPQEPGFDAYTIGTSNLLLVALTLAFFSNRAAREIERVENELVEEKRRTETLLKREVAHQVAERSRELGSALERGSGASAPLSPRRWARDLGDPGAEVGSRRAGGRTSRGGCLVSVLRVRGHGRRRRLAAGRGERRRLGQPVRLAPRCVRAPRRTALPPTRLRGGRGPPGRARRAARARQRRSSSRAARDRTPSRPRAATSLREPIARDAEPGRHGRGGLASLSHAHRTARDAADAIAWQLAEASDDVSANPFVSLLEAYAAGLHPFAIGPSEIVALRTSA